MHPRLLTLIFLIAGPCLIAQTILETITVQPNFFMIAGAGGNIAVQVGPDGVLVVDTGAAEFTPAVLAQIRKISPQPVRYIIDTGADADHIGGNLALAKMGGAVAPIVSTDNVLTRMTATPGYNLDSLPTETFLQKQKTMYFNREGIQILARPGAHSDSDAVVFFRRSDVIVTGEIFDPRRFPVIDVAHGGTIQKEIDALNFLIDLAIPSIPFMSEEGGTMIVPGHGWPCEQADVVEYRDMVTIIRDRVAALKKKGMTLEAVQAANPAAGYRSRYGADTGSWTTGMFVEAIYKTL
jgi:glyoxylase-like metal-dependent hydrolase (beta-lactamase superfamily II)